jgi:hypothetical protein
MIKMLSIMSIALDATILRSKEAIKMRVELRKDLAKTCSDAKKACYGVAKTQTSTRVVDGHRREMIDMANLNEEILNTLQLGVNSDVEKLDKLDHAIAILKREEDK